MKQTFIYVVIVFLIGFARCSNKTDNVSTMDEWKEMDDFHLIMAEAFHPYKDSSNLIPVKNLAEEMSTLAEKWANATLPKKVDNEEVKLELQKLKVDTRALADLIKSKADNETIGSSLNALHDSFHEIMEAWHDSGEKHEH